MFGPRSLRLLSIVFVAVLATYSGVWMYYIHAQESANARGFEHEFRPSELAAVVTAVRPTGVGMRAGLREGDRIVGVDGQPLDSYDRLLDAFGRTPPGRSLSLQVARAGGARTIIFPVTRNRDTA
jgi:S1-C subfamily serine protease